MVKIWQLIDSFCSYIPIYFNAFWYWNIWEHWNEAFSAGIYLLKVNSGNIKTVWIMLKVKSYNTLLSFALFSKIFRVYKTNPENVYLFKVNYRNIIERCEICLKLT